MTGTELGCRIARLGTRARRVLALLALAAAALACNVEVNDMSGPPTAGGARVPTATSLPSAGGPVGGEVGRVVRVIDGDTIDVEVDGSTFRVRYVGVNTPERDEVCYREALDANRNLVQGQTVRLVRDTTDTDRFGRLLRYVYVGEVHVGEVLVRDGWAEAVLYRPDGRFHEQLVALEQSAARAGRGCHPTGIFDDGTTTR